VKARIEKAFQPVVITVETEDEMRGLMEILATAKNCNRNACQLKYDVANMMYSFLSGPMPFGISGEVGQ